MAIHRLYHDVNGDAEVGRRVGHISLFAVDVGMDCDHGCSYCNPDQPTGSPGHRTSYVGSSEDAEARWRSLPQRVAADARSMKERGRVLLCSSSDAWSPEAQRFQLGRRCLQALLQQPGWTVRILTKNAAVTNDYPLIARYPERVLVGLSITATPDQRRVTSVLEPRASAIADRMAALAAAKRAGLRVYASFAPLLPGVADSPENVDRLVRFAASLELEEVWVKPINPLNFSVESCTAALASSGFHRQAEAIERLGSPREWCQHAVILMRTVRQSFQRHFDVARLRFMLNPDFLLPDYLDLLRQDSAGVFWMGNPWRVPRVPAHVRLGRFLSRALVSWVRPRRRE